MLGGWDAQFLFLLLASKPYSILASKPYAIVEPDVFIFNGFSKIKNHARKTQSWRIIYVLTITKEYDSIFVLINTLPTVSLYYINRLFI